MNSLVPVAFAAMAAAALLLPTTADRWRAAFGLPAFLLGVASIPHLPEFQGPSLTVWISAGLLALGPALLALATWQARARFGRGAVAPWVVLIAVGVGCAAATPIIARGGTIPALLTAGALGLGFLLAWLVAETLGAGRAVRWLDARLPSIHRRHTWGTLCSTR
jgi:hypothetical protein